MDNPSYFDNLKELSDEEFLYEVFQNTINSMSMALINIKLSQSQGRECCNQ